VKYEDNHADVRRKTYKQTNNVKEQTLASKQPSSAGLFSSKSLRPHIASPALPSE